ncbi:HipA domain-containing protein [Pseudarthrobacter sp. DSP2-3-2b1]|uniref:HipA domain-containing protein n=1 Tax=Pseudarthrobacter sp. DSP2-3-2b1 TaxID=2804661 RepID=UPI003CEBC182
MEQPSEFVDLTQWIRAEEEPSGENENRWFIAPDESRWMFKANPIERSANVHSAELVASRIAPLVGIPAAEVRLAEYLGEIGCISRNVKSEPRNQLTHAAVFISEYAVDFDPKAKGGIGHSLANIGQVLAEATSPIGREKEGMSAASWFAGYLVFDALIANQDRHSENWALEIDAGGAVHIAPSYDHGTSLGIVNRNVDKLPGLLSSQERLFPRSSSELGEPASKAAPKSLWSTSPQHSASSQTPRQRYTGAIRSALWISTKSRKSLPLQKCRRQTISWQQKSFDSTRKGS